MNQNDLPSVITMKKLSLDSFFIGIHELCGLYDMFWQHGFHRNLVTTFIADQSRSCASPDGDKLIHIMIKLRNYVDVARQ